MKSMLLKLMLLFGLSSCTVSLQNVSTHGTADDLIDEEQTASPSTQVTASAIPK